MRSVCEEFRPWADSRAELVERPGTDVFSGLLGSYGTIRGAPSLLVFVADASADGPGLRHLGYTAEGVVLEATALGLGTCWVSGFFDPFKAAKLVTLAPGERVVAVSPLGRAVEQATGTERLVAGAASSHSRLTLDEIAPGYATWPRWGRAAISAARVAPSATNRQPWRFALKEGALLISRDSRWDLPRTSKWLDIGIASLHAELGARAEGVAGRWVDAIPETSGLEICRYLPDSSGARVG